jgi:hypothetical protein
MNRRRARLQFEELESRTLLSAAGLAAPVKVSAAVVRTTPPPAVLSGTITGTYVLGPSLSTTGATYQLTGSGSVGPAGAVTASAFLQALRFLSPGHAGGLVTLSNARGTVVVQPSGTAQAGGVRLPATFTFRVAWGTGAYAHLNHGGTVGLRLTPASHPTRTDSGSFLLTFGR